MREWEANANGGGKHLWAPDVMLCKARVAPSPAAIPPQVSLTLCNWAGKGHGPSRVLPPAPGFRRGMGLWDRAGNVQPAGHSAGTCRECSQRICHGGAVLLAAELGCPAKYGKRFPIKWELCMHNKRVIFWWLRTTQMLKNSLCALSEHLS